MDEGIRHYFWVKGQVSMEKIVYVGKQRCGTTSFGDFFEANGFKRFGWRQIEKSGLSELHYQMRWGEILELGLLNDYQVFEDGPFQDPRFALFLYRNLGGVRIAYLRRPPEDWFTSMLKHSRGYTLGDLEKHCFSYDLLPELNYLQNASQDTKPEKLKIELMKSHYVKKYLDHQFQVHYLFQTLPTGHFFSGDLYTPGVFAEIANYFGLEPELTADKRSHKSTASISDILDQNNINARRIGLNKALENWIRRSFGEFLGR